MPLQPQTAESVSLRIESLVFSFTQNEPNTVGFVRRSREALTTVPTFIVGGRPPMRRKASLILPLLHLLPSKVIARWEIFEGYDASSGHNFAVPLAANAIIPTDCITACERVADCHGFVYSQVLATSGCYFRSDSAAELAESRRSSSGATLYVMVTSPAVDEARFWLDVVIASCVMSVLVVGGGFLWCVLAQRYSSMPSPRDSPRDYTVSYSRPQQSRSSNKLSPSGDHRGAPRDLV
jgi:hypothetical protein